MPKGLAFLCKQLIKLLRSDVVAFQLSPGVGVGVSRVDTTDEVFGKPIANLIAIECLKGAREDDPTKVP
jgi:hypothetical protein